MLNRCGNGYARSGDRPGNANTLVAVQGRESSWMSPSVVALEKGTRKVLGRGTAVGSWRDRCGSRFDHSGASSARRSDHDFELCEAMLRYFIKKAIRKKRRLPRAS